MVGLEAAHAASSGRSSSGYRFLMRASPVLLTGVAALMAVSLLLTMSRSVIGAAGLAILGTAVLAARRQDTRAKKIASITIVASDRKRVRRGTGSGSAR